MAYKYVNLKLLDEAAFFSGGGLSRNEAEFAVTNLINTIWLDIFDSQADLFATLQQAVGSNPEATFSSIFSMSENSRIDANHLELGHLRDFDLLSRDQCVSVLRGWVILGISCALVIPNTTQQLVRNHLSRSSFVSVATIRPASVLLAEWEKRESSYASAARAQLFQLHANTGYASEVKKLLDKHGEAG